MGATYLCKAIQVLVRHRICRRRVVLSCLMLVGLLGSAGCASLTNPAASGIPVRRLPKEYLALPREEQLQIPLTLLRQKRPEVYRLGAGDVLGLYIENVLGDKDVQPPVRFPEKGTASPAFGFPVPVREDGTISLPLIPGGLDVKGKSIPEVERLLIKTYTERKILISGKERVVVTLFEPRTTRVLVLRQDSGGLSISGAGVIGSASRGTGALLDLPAYENDVLNALTLTGGLPGSDAADEIIVQKGYYRKGQNPSAILKMFSKSGLTELPPFKGEGLEVIRIPLRLNPGQPLPFKPEDIILDDGDVVFIDNRDAEVFYVGGILVPRQFVLPRDFDLRVIEAVSLAGGPFVNGLITQNNLAGNVAQLGIGAASPSQITVLRKTKDRGQIPIKVDLNRAIRDRRENIIIMPGDVIVMQETVGQSLSRYLTGITNFNLIFELFRDGATPSTEVTTFP